VAEARAVETTPVPVLAGLRLRPEAVVRTGRAAPIVQLLAGSSPMAEELRILRAKLQAMDSERSLRCLGLVSASSGEGKSTVAIGLAMSLARDGKQRVLLIEADMRRPALERYLGLERAEGLGNYLGSAASDIAVRHLDPEGFWLLSAGTGAAPAPEELKSERMQKLLDSARRGFDAVVVDCPPVAPVADSVLLQDLVDGLLFVVRARHSPIETISKALYHLRSERIVGVVMNDNRELLTSYYRYSYRRYHDSY